MIKRRKWDNWLSQNYSCIEISTCLPAFIYINVNLTRITSVLGIADIAGKRTYTNTMLDWTRDNLVPGVLSPYDVGKLSLPRVLSSDWSISISVEWTVCQATLVYPCIPLFTLVYPWIPLYTSVYPCVPLNTLVYFCLPLFTLEYPCIPLFTLVYPWIPLYTPVYPCIPLNTLVYPCLPLNIPEYPLSSFDRVGLPGLYVEC